MAEYALSHFNYWVVVVLMMLGLYVVFASPNMVKRLAGLSVFQTSVFLFYITIGKVTGGIPPILPEDHGGDDDHAEPGHADPDHSSEAGASASSQLEGGHAEAADAAHGAGHDAGALDTVEFPASALDQAYSNPLPHVLILTAIVVGVATLAVGLALVVLIREAYGSIEDDDISRAEYDAEVAGGDA